MVRLCDRGMILENGEVFKIGEAEMIATEYTKLIFSNKAQADEKITPNLDLENKSEGFRTNVPEISENRLKFDDGHERYGNRLVEILSVDVCNSKGISSTEFKTGEVIQIKIRLKFNVEHDAVIFGAGIRDRSASIIWSSSSLLHTGKLIRGKAGDELSAVFEGYIPLASGKYFLFISLADGNAGEFMDYIENAFLLSVEGSKGITDISVVDLHASLNFNIHSSN